MAYTISHRQAGVTRGDVGGLIRHEFRDVDKSNGVETQHSNERIDPSRTSANQSWLFVDGKAVRLDDSSQITEELDRRLASAGGTRTNKKTGKVSRVAVRSDAKVVRNIVVQLDPEFTGSSEYLLSKECPKEHAQLVRSHLKEMTRHYSDVYGAENMLAASLHLDETSPHMHLMITPIDDLGRVRNASFIEDGKGPNSGMAKNDKAMRERMKSVGYDVDAEPRGLNRSHMSVDAFSRHMDRERQLAKREAEVEALAAKAEQKALRAAQTAQDARLASQRALASEKAIEAAVEAYKAAESRQEEARGRMGAALKTLQLRNEKPGQAVVRDVTGAYNSAKDALDAGSAADRARREALRKRLVRDLAESDGKPAETQWFQK